MTRVGMLYPERDPASPVHWSGTPHGLFKGLKSQGIEVVPIGYHLPPIVRHAVFTLSHTRGRRGAVAYAAPIKAAARSRVLARNVRCALPLDGLIAMGTDYYDLSRVVPSGLPVATYDDGNFALFMRYAHSDLRQNGFPEHEVRQWCVRQAIAARVATACCVPTTWAANSMVSDYGVRHDRVHVVGMGHRARRDADPDREWS